MAPPLGLGLAGCGKFGAFCLAAAADLPDTVVVPVTDVEPGKGRTFEPEHLQLRRLA
jgi:predicted dehydrogenase